MADKGVKAPEKRKLFKQIFGHDKKDIYKLVVDKLTKLSEEKMELRGLLLMGGAYGHMAHPFDDSNLTFNDFKSMITRLLKGGINVEGVTEKLGWSESYGVLEEWSTSSGKKQRPNQKLW